MVHLTTTLSLLATAGSAFAFQGSMTWFSPRGAMTGCVPAVAGAQMAIALPAAAWDGGAHCGKQISITAEGKSVTATVVGQSITSVDAFGLDATPELFQSFGTLDMGVVNVDWSHV